MVRFNDYLNIKKLTVSEYINIKQNVNKVPNELINCTCCIRHKFNFPKNNKWIDIHKSTKNVNKKVCKCPCRHVARNLFRQCCLDTADLKSIEENENSGEESIGSESESIGSESETRSEDSESESIGSDDSFIVKDTMSKKARKELNKIKKRFKNS
tara:strand:- start:22 stop:489 length:468 start_codon:yes stop_codon:yes gene_type:complete